MCISFQNGTINDNNMQVNYVSHLVRFTSTFLTQYLLRLPILKNPKQRLIASTMIFLSYFRVAEVRSVGFIAFTCKLIQNIQSLRSCLKWWCSPVAVMNLSASLSNKCFTFEQTARTSNNLSSFARNKWNGQITVGILSVLYCKENKNLINQN